MSLTTRLIAMVVICAALIAGWWRLTAYYDNRGYQRRAAEDAAAAEAQADRNRELQRTAEKHYTVQAEAREEFIVTTVKEIRHETDNLAACVLTPGALRRLRDAAECAGKDSCSTGGSGQPVLSTR